MDAIVCPECGHAVPYGRLTCPACGTLLAAVSGGSRRGQLTRTSVDEPPAEAEAVSGEGVATPVSVSSLIGELPAEAAPPEPTLRQSALVMPIPEAPSTADPPAVGTGEQPAEESSPGESSASVAEPELEPAAESSLVEADGSAAGDAPGVEPAAAPAAVAIAAEAVAGAEAPPTLEPAQAESPAAGPASHSTVPSILRDWNGAIPASYVPPELRPAAAPPEELAADSVDQRAEEPAEAPPFVIAEAPAPVPPAGALGVPPLPPSGSYRAPADVPAMPASGPAASPPDLPLPPGSSTPAYLPRGTARRAPATDAGQPDYGFGEPQPYGAAAVSAPPPPQPGPLPGVPATQAGGPVRPPALAGRTIESPERVEEWAVLVGAVLAVASFILPWVPSQNVLVGGNNGDSYFDRWGLGTASNVMLFIVVLVFLAIAVLATQVPPRLRFGVLPVGIGGALAGVGWIYIGLPLGFGFGVGLLVVGAVAMIVGGGLELRHAHGSSSVA